MNEFITINDKTIEDNPVIINIMCELKYHQAYMSPAFCSDYLKMWEELKESRKSIGIAKDIIGFVNSGEDIKRWQSSIVNLEKL